MTSSNNPRGLEPEEAARRLTEHGRNQLPPPPRRGLGRIAAQVMTEPMFLLLALAAAAYLVLGEPAEGALLGGFAMFALSVCMALAAHRPARGAAPAAPAGPARPRGDRLSGDSRQRRRRSVDGAAVGAAALRGLS